MNIKCPYCNYFLTKNDQKSYTYSCTNCIWYLKTSKIRIHYPSDGSYFFVIDKYAIYANQLSKLINIHDENSVNLLFTIKYIPPNLVDLNETISLIRGKILKLKAFI